MAETGGAALPEQRHPAGTDIGDLPEAQSPAVAPDALQSSGEGDQDALQRSWQFAAVVQFCRMFGSILRIRPFSADILERALLEPSDHRMFLSELLCKLLRADASAPYGERDCDAWEDLLNRKLHTSWRTAFVGANPLADQGFYTISPLLRVLCSTTESYIVVQIIFLGRSSHVLELLHSCRCFTLSVIGGSTTVRL